jgi:alkylhydroperoxidase family enzyme
MKVMFFFTRRQFGMVPQPLSVFCARMPSAFARFFWKVSALDKKLELPYETAFLVRERVKGINGCEWCMDVGRWFAVNKMPHMLAKLDALPEFRTDPVFSDRERAALTYATELTESKHVSQAAFDELARHYSEREICDIVWCISSEHIYNINNHGLNIGSDGLCKVPGTSWVKSAPEQLAS